MKRFLNSFKFLFTSLVILIASVLVLLPSGEGVYERIFFLCLSLLAYSLSWFYFSMVFLDVPFSPKNKKTPFYYPSLIVVFSSSVVINFFYNYFGSFEYIGELMDSIIHFLTPKWCNWGSDTFSKALAQTFVFAYLLQILVIILHYSPKFFKRSGGFYPFSPICNINKKNQPKSFHSFYLGFILGVSWLVLISITRMGHYDLISLIFIIIVVPISYMIIKQKLYGDNKSYPEVITYVIGVFDGLIRGLLILMIIAVIFFLTMFIIRIFG